MSRNTRKSNAAHAKNLKKLKATSVLTAILPLASCGGEGDEGAVIAAPPAPPPAGPPPGPPGPSAGFTLVATNTYLADNNLNSTFNQSFSSTNLTVAGRNGSDTITTGSGNDVLLGMGGNDTLNGGSGDDLIEGGSGADAINGGSGFDWAYYQESSSAINVNLLTGATSGGDAQGDTFSSIEHVFGSIHNDTITGNAGVNVIAGYKGADTLNGGGGFDFLSYAASTSGVNVSLTTGIGTGGDAQGDNFSNFEGIFGSDNIDTLTGDTQNNELYGLDGNDTLNGGDGDDFIIGDDGNDTLNGDAGNDLIRGDLGSDTIDGGDGIDTLNYFGSTTAVTVNLATGTGSGGTAQGDNISNIENVYGSEFNDTITGDTGNNIIAGFDGADAMDGGDGLDTVAYYFSPGAVTVSLASGTGLGGDAQGDTFSNFERIHGSDFGDTLTGDAGDNVISGFKGTDVLSGGAGDDTFFAFQVDGSEADQIDGGADYDIIRFTGSSTVTPYSLNLATINPVNIESIRMGHDFREALTLTAADVIAATDGGNTLDVLGHDTDAVSSGSTWAYVNDVMVQDEIYHQYTSGAATVNVYLEIGSQTGFAKPAASFTETSMDVFEAIDNSNSSVSHTHDEEDLMVTGKGGDDLIGTGSGNDTIIGGAGNDGIAGHGGDDTIDGGLGTDIIFGGGGDDILVYDNLDTYDGGTGSDTLNVTGTGENIDLSTVDLTDMEIIDLTGTGNNQITFVIQDILDTTDENDQMIFDGNAGDDVTSAGQGWVQGADQVIDAETYNTYTAGGATLLVDEDITQNIT